MLTSFPHLPKLAKIDWTKSYFRDLDLAENEHRPREIGALTLTLARANGESAWSNEPPCEMSTTSRQHVVPPLVLVVAKEVTLEKFHRVNRGSLRLRRRYSLRYPTFSSSLVPEYLIAVSASKCQRTTGKAYGCLGSSRILAFVRGVTRKLRIFTRICISSSNTYIYIYTY